LTAGSPGIDFKHPASLWFSGVIAYALVVLTLFELSIFAHLSALPFVIVVAFGVCAVTLFLCSGLAMFTAVELCRPAMERARRIAQSSLFALDLLELLQELDRIRYLALLSSHQRRTVIGQIVRCANRLLRFHDFLPNPAGDWARIQMRLAAENLLRLAAWVYLPREGTLTALKAEVIRYLNATLTGNLDAFPRGHVGAAEGLVFTRQELRGWRKAVVYAGLAAYLLLPVFTYAALVLIFRLEPRLSPPIQAAATLAYLIWALFGVSSFSRLISPDTRELLTDTIRLLIGKK